MCHECSPMLPFITEIPAYNAIIYIYIYIYISGACITATLIFIFIEIYPLPKMRSKGTWEHVHKAKGNAHWDWRTTVRATYIEYIKEVICHYTYVWEEKQAIILYTLYHNILIWMLQWNWHRRKRISTLQTNIYIIPSGQYVLPVEWKLNYQKF